MRELEPMKRGKQQKELNIQTSKKVKTVINLIDKLIAGKRFGELDSAKQMYLLDCQAKLEDMENGYFTVESLEFLYGSINSLIAICYDAKLEIGNYIDHFKEE